MVAIFLARSAAPFLGVCPWRLKRVERFERAGLRRRHRRSLEQIFQIVILNGRDRLRFT
jgi:hypothetical protein